MWEFLDDLLPMMERMAENTAKRVYKSNAWQRISSYTGGSGSGAAGGNAGGPQHVVVDNLFDVQRDRSRQSSLGRDELDAAASRYDQGDYGPQDEKSELQTLLDKAGPEDHKTIRKAYYRREQRKRVRAMLDESSGDTETHQEGTSWRDRIVSGPRGMNKRVRGRLSLAGRAMQMGAGRLGSVRGMGGVSRVLGRMGLGLQAAGGMGVGGAGAGGLGALGAGGLGAGATAGLIVAIPLAVVAVVAALAKFTQSVQSAGESLLDTQRTKFQNYSGKIAVTGAETELSRMQMDMLTARETENDTAELATEMKALREATQPFEAAFTNLKLDVFTGLAMAATELAQIVASAIIEAQEFKLWVQAGGLNPFKQEQADAVMAQVKWARELAEQLRKNAEMNVDNAPRRFIQGWAGANAAAGQRDPLRPLP